MAKKRTRAVSLSLDWASMVKDEESEKKSRSHLAGVIPFDRDLVEFCTRSTYSGKWNTLGMAVYGNYIYPYGCEYEGGFEDGMFHGEGTLIYPMGQRLEGIWEKGKMMSYKFTNSDGLEYADNWRYCVMPDRRFNVCFREGLQPAGREFMTNQQPDRPLYPELCDTGDGYYNPAMRVLLKARDLEDYESLEDKDASIPPTVTSGGSSKDFLSQLGDSWIPAVTMVNKERHRWILEHCRKGWDEPAGYRPEFYKDWVSGRQKELEELDDKYEQGSSDDESSGDVKSVSSDAEVKLTSDGKKSLEYAGTGRKLTSKISVDK